METTYNPKDFGKVVVLMGGDSDKREMSLATGDKVLKSLARSGVNAVGLDVQQDVLETLLTMKPDYAFIVLHDDQGEDGSLQGLLDCLKIPYTGSRLVAAAITMEQPFTKLIWQSTQIPTSLFRLVINLEEAITVMEKLGLPLCVKSPKNSRSATLTKVNNPEQLPAAFNKAAEVDSRVMIEPWIPGNEFIVGIFENKALPAIKVHTENFETEYCCPCGLALEMEMNMQMLAYSAFQVTGGRGWGSVKLIEDHLGDWWFTKINTVPNMDLMEKAAKILRIEFDELVIRVLSYARTHPH
jgi:D-alanine-D-alanine ligase